MSEEERKKAEDETRAWWNSNSSIFIAIGAIVFLFLLLGLGIFFLNKKLHKDVKKAKF